MLKTNLLTCLLIIAGLQILHAQETTEKPKKEKKKEGYFTLRIGGGYAWNGFLNQGGVMGPVVDPYHPERDGLIVMANRNFYNDSSTQIVNGGYGKGLNYTLGLGYMANPYVGFDMGISILSSAPISSTERHEIVLATPPFGYVNVGKYFDAKITTSAFMLTLNPSIVVNAAKPGWKVYPYARLGLTLPVYGGLTHNIDITLEEAAQSNTALLDVLKGEPYFLGKETKVKLKTEGTVSLGINGAVGVAYKPLPYLGIFAEVNGQYLVTRAKETTITQYDVDGVSKLEERGEYRTHFVYTNKLDKTSNNADYNENYDRTKPKEDFRPNGPFSNIGFNIGLTFMLSKAILKEAKAKPEATPVQ